MSSIVAPRLTNKEIRDQAEKFRKEYAENEIPVPIVEILEFDLKITPAPIPNMQSTIDVDGFLSTDLKYIFVDQVRYFDSKYENRLRFTFAHEIGHLILHKDIITNCRFRNESAWKQFRLDMSSYDHSIIEQQANEFAGRLLVPKQELIEEIIKLSDKIEQYYNSGYGKNNLNLLIDYISSIICLRFEVSSAVIAKRICNEKINILKECDIV